MVERDLLKRSLKRSLEPLIYACDFFFYLYDAPAACPPTSSGVCIPVSIQYALVRAFLLGVPILFKGLSIGVPILFQGPF